MKPKCLNLKCQEATLFICMKCGGCPTCCRCVSASLTYRDSREGAYAIHETRRKAAGLPPEA